MNENQEPQKHYLLICTVGGSPEPLAASLLHWRPTRAVFLRSCETQPQIERILELIRKKNFHLAPHDREEIVLSDPQNLRAALRRLRKLNDKVVRWRRMDQSDRYRVVVDPTGGTKQMSVALALTARPWACTFSYIGGQSRTRNGIGVVVSGAEQTVIAENPWNALGYQDIEEARLLFDQGAFTPAARQLERARDAADDPAVARALSVLQQLCEAYDLWDRFQHGKAEAKLKNSLKNRSDLAEIFQEEAHDILEQIEDHRQLLDRLTKADDQEEALVHDLIANADRRAHQGRYDDAVARLYRAIEALAQIRLRTCYNIDTSEVRLDQLPQKLQDKCRHRIKDEPLKLGLQDAYELLHELDDPVGGRFFKETTLGKKECTPLSARNQSILAHGFQPISYKTFNNLLEATLILADIKPSHLPCFPTLLPTRNR